MRLGRTLGTCGGGTDLKYKISLSFRPDVDGIAASYEPNDPRSNPAAIFFMILRLNNTKRRNKRGLWCLPLNDE